MCKSDLIIKALLILAALPRCVVSESTPQAPATESLNAEPLVYKDALERYPYITRMAPELIASKEEKIITTAAGQTSGSGMAQQVDHWFRYLADGSAEQQREAITNLWSPHTNPTREKAAVREYPFDVSRSEGGSKIVRENRERCEIMLRAIPRLIEAVRVETNSPAPRVLPLKYQAGSLLFNIQGMGPSSQDYEAWHRGWELHGIERFEQH